jgi:uncharacterized membrane protein YfcA
VQAVALTIVPSLVTNVWQGLAGGHMRELMGRFWTMIAGVCLGIGLGGGLLVRDGSGRAVIAVGVVLVLHSALGLSRFRFSVPARAERWLSPATGLVTGLIAAVTGLNVVPAVPYLQATGIGRDRLVQTIGLFLIATTVAMGANLFFHGAFGLPVAGLSLASLLPTLAGLLLGQAARRRVPEPAFARCFLVGMMALGAYLAVRNLL